MTCFYAKRGPDSSLKVMYGHGEQTLGGPRGERYGMNAGTWNNIGRKSFTGIYAYACARICANNQNIILYYG